MAHVGVSDAGGADDDDDCIDVHDDCMMLLLMMTMINSCVSCDISPHNSIISFS